MSKFEQIPMNAIFRIVGKDSTIYKKVHRGHPAIDIYFRDWGKFINPPTDTSMHANIHKKLEKNGFQSVPRHEFEELRKEFQHPIDIKTEVIFLGEIYEQY